MKTLVLILTVCVTLLQSQVNAATTNLVSSLLEIEAITSYIGDPSFTEIPSVESIVDIRRITHDINVFGKVKYEILTRFPRNVQVAVVGDEEMDCHSHDPDYRTHSYIARLLVEPNPGIGPNIVTVESIRRARH